LEFFGGSKSISLKKGGDVVVKSKLKDLDGGVNCLYYAALVRFISAAKEVGISLNFRSSDLFTVLSTFAGSGEDGRIRERGNLIGDARRMFFISATIKENPDVVRAILSQSEHASMRQKFSRAELGTLDRKIFEFLHLSSREASSLAREVVNYVTARLLKSADNAELVVTLSRGESSAVLSNGLGNDVEQIASRSIQAFALFYRPKQTRYSYEALLKPLPTGGSLLDMLSLDRAEVLKSNAILDYDLEYVLECLGSFDGSGARLSRAINFISSLKPELSSTAPLGIKSVDRSLQHFGEEATRNAIILADALRTMYGSDILYFAQHVDNTVEKTPEPPRSVSSVISAVQFLSELKVSIDDQRYFKVAHLACQMLDGGIGLQNTKQILSLVGNNLSPVLLCVKAMIPIWRDGQIPSTGDELAEQVKRLGYRGMLINWVGNEELVGNSYAAIGKKFLAVYRQSIRDFEANGIPEYRWLGNLQRDFVAAFTAAHVQSRFSEGGLAKAARSLLRNNLLIDSPPYPIARGEEPDSDYARCYGESVQTIFSALSLYYGQGALMFAARRSSSSRNSAIENFAKHCCAKNQVVRGIGGSFPGSGVLMQGLVASRVFPPVSLNRDLESALPIVLRNQPCLSDSAVFYLRGCRIVIPPESKDFNVLGQPVALLAFQDHFGDSDHNGVVLVARKAATQLVERVCNGERFNDSQDILNFCRSIGSRVLQLSSISCLGGLCNSFEVGSAPLWRWEGKPDFAYSTRDFSGHVHKYFGVGAMQYGSPSPKVLSGLKRYADAHAEIYRVASRLFDIELAWRTAMQRYQLGHYYGTESGEDIYSPSNFEGDLEFPKFGYTALVDALRWHFNLRASGTTDRTAYPVLVVANPLDHWSRPPTNVYLDTYDMRLSDNGDTYQFSVPAEMLVDDMELVSKLPDKDKFAWKFRMWGPAEILGHDLRFEHRHRLGGDFGG
jgi:hypothetical protein